LEVLEEIYEITNQGGNVSGYAAIVKVPIHAKTFKELMEGNRVEREYVGKREGY
jgi:hypothetical protein